MNHRSRAWRFLVGLLNGRNAPELVASLERAARARPECWTDLVSLANEHLVTGALWSSLQRSALEQALPAETADYLRSFHAFNAARNRAILAQLNELVDALNSAGIEPMPLKGSGYLVAGLFPELGDRYLSDIDLLVPEGADEEAGAILRELGYAPAYERDYSRHHHLVPMVRDGQPVAIELHRAPLPDYASRGMPAAELWAKAQLTTVGNVRSRLASPTDAVMLSFVHSYIVDRNDTLLLIPLRLFHDVQIVLQRHEHQVDWQRNTERAAALDAATRLRRYLHVLHAVTGAGPGGAVRAALADRVHFLMCRAVVAWPRLAVWAQRAERHFNRAELR
jgi:hypothetical protein